MQSAGGFEWNWILNLVDDRLVCWFSKSVLEIVTYIWHPILLRPITIWLHMIHGAQHTLWFHHDALESLEFEQLMWLTTSDYYLFHVYLFECVAAAILVRLHSFSMNFVHGQHTQWCKWFGIDEMHPTTGYHQIYSEIFRGKNKKNKKSNCKNVSINLYANSRRT